MFVFASAVTDPDVYARAAAAGVDRLREEDPSIEQIVFASVGSIFRNYNLIIDQVKDGDDVEALVLIHQDAEIQDPGFVDKVRAALEDPEVAIVGCAGAVDVRSIAWWEGSITWASFTHRYDELGGGEIPAFSWMTESLPPYARLGEVDSIDGFVMGLSPWAMHNLRFDESLGQIHGYDFDICMQARAAGKKVVTADLQVVHHHSLRLIDNPETWINAYMRVAEKWDEQIPHNGSRDRDWEWRARRAEAEASAARLMGGVEELLRVAHWKQLDALQNSLSWRITAPLRRLRQRLAPRRPG
ncbi:MAG: glycosyltransferase [Solirubrobacterales bacterium]